MPHEFLPVAEKQGLCRNGNPCVPISFRMKEILPQKALLGCEGSMHHDLS